MVQVELQNIETGYRYMVQVYGTGTRYMVHGTGYKYMEHGTCYRFIVQEHGIGTWYRYMV